MIERVTITPNGERQPLDIEVHGLLAALLVDNKEKPSELVEFTGLFRLREQDLNLRPSGYEPDELPGCSIPRQRR